LVVLATAAVAMLVMVPVASAQDDSYPPGTTPTTVVDREPPFDVSQSETELPFTGGQAAALVIVGLVTLGTGVVLVRAGRRSQAETS
jgi:hypothetical protein